MLRRHSRVRLPVRETEGHAAARECADARATRAIVGVGDEQIGGTRLLENLRLRVRDRVGRRKESQMRVSDIRPDAHVGLSDADQRADFTSVIHTELDHCHVRLPPQLEQRERQANVIVQIPLVPKHAVARGQEIRRQLLRRRLARASGDRHDLRPRSPPDFTRDVLQGPRRVADHDQNRRGPAACLGMPARSPPRPPHPPRARRPRTRARRTDRRGPPRTRRLALSSASRSTRARAGDRGIAATSTARR